ncbi:MAG: tetratricopeptide repeat protein [Candidatus Wallbacteria bacterium]|nr:tetratricopeptide repeat protein [Candidatus Wallbacteria bacterium]
MKYLPILLICSMCCLQLAAAENILGKIDFASQIFYPRISFSDIRTAEQALKGLLELPESGPRTELLLKFLTRTDEPVIQDLYELLLRHMESNPDELDQGFLLLTRFRLLDPRNEFNRLEFYWQLVSYARIHTDDPWALFLTAGFLFSLQEEDNKLKTDTQPTGEEEKRRRLDPYAAMEKAIMLSPSPQIHYLIAQVFRQLAYTNMNAHKIVILELNKAEAILKVQNKASYQLFLAKETELLRDFIELYRFYHTDPPFYLEESLYQKMIELDESNGVAYNNLGDLYVRYNTRLEDAEKLIDKALELCRENPSVMETKGYLHLRKKEFPQAEEWLKKAVALDRKMLIGYEHLAELYYETGEMDQCLAAYETLLGLDPGNPRYYNDLGYLLADNGRELEKALELCRKAVQMSPQSGPYLDSLAWTHYKLGQFDQAGKIIAMAVENEPEERFILYHAGLINFSLGDFEKAREVFLKALAMQSDWDDIIRCLGAMQLFREGEITAEQLKKFVR